MLYTLSLISCLRVRLIVVIVTVICHRLLYVTFHCCIYCDICCMLISRGPTLSFYFDDNIYMV